MQRKNRVIGGLAVLAAAVILGTALASGTSSRSLSAAKPPPGTGACALGQDGKVKHVIYVQFDNTHFLRDNPNVPSDLEQMPNLLNFMKQNGTLLTNDHTVLISHTGGGILSTETGLYPDRTGQPVSNAYGYFKPDGSVGFSSTFKYWTDQTDPVADPKPNMVNGDSTDLGGTGAARMTPAPWVPYTRAGCDVGGVGLANIELENNNAIIPATGATDPTGDITKVFGENSPEWNEAKASQLASSSPPGRQLAQTDFVGIAIHCASGGGICNANTANARTDSLPDEQGGYSGFKALFGAKYVDPAITKAAASPSGSPCVNDTTGAKIVDPFGQCGFPGFDGMLAKSTLGYVAQMQEAGVPVTYAYISDAHDFHGVSGNTHVAYGPGEAGYVQQLKDYDKAFGDFFTRLKHDGITKDNTLFVITVEEGDHFAGTAPDNPACDGVHTACTYANGHVTEVNGDLKRLVATYNASHGTAATTDFSVHSDMAPNVYITGNPARDSKASRDLEQAMSDMTVVNPLSGDPTHLFVAMADPVEEKLLHMVSADPQRTPTFTPFAAGDFFLNGSATTTCANNDLSNCVFLPNTTPPNQTFAWNHGGVQPEIATTWVGYVGPGIQNRLSIPGLRSDLPDLPVLSGLADRLQGLQAILQALRGPSAGNQPWTDHTDVRPTMLALLGLKDSYVNDGRVVTEILKDDALPGSLRGRQDTAEKLGAAYKQIMASFGEFSLDTLTASTGALASNTFGDTTYTDTESKLADLGARRDALAGQIRAALWGAEFGNQRIDGGQARDWIDQANALLDEADALAGKFAYTDSKDNADDLAEIKHFVVIYEENHSFDNLLGGWEGVNGLADADAAHTTQVSQTGVPFTCLKQDDVNLTSPPLPVSCTDATTATPFTSAFTNGPFAIDTYIPSTAVTCPKPTVFGPANGLLKGDPAALPGGCTRDLVHRYYQEGYQLDGGKQDRYVTGSDAIGLTMGHFTTTSLPVYQYLHSRNHPDYAIADNFFQSAFGGSYLNHQWLIAAASPTWNAALNDGSADDLHSVLDANGMPNNYPLYASPLGANVKDQQLTQSCSPAISRPPLQPTLACGNYTVNTTQPFVQPFSPGTAVTRRLPLEPASYPTIGDTLTDANVDWAWYSGGWSNANGDVNGPGWTNGTGPKCSDPNVNTNAAVAYPICPDGLFQFHHQPFNYYANYAPGAPGRAHLQDEVAFQQLAQSSSRDCNLKPVSFIKPLGEQNEHPGYGSEAAGNTHLVDLLKMVEDGPCARDTMVIVTYDEFGGQWDHVSPPGQGNDNGPHDVWGPGTRIPAIVLAPHLRRSFVVDDTEHDTTSVIATLEHRYGLPPLATRDGAVPDMSTVFDAKRP